jgi:hypothetical protein
MINQFPVLVVRKTDNPHSKNDNLDTIYNIGILGFTWNVKK